MSANLYQAAFVAHLVAAILFVGGLLLATLAVAPDDALLRRLHRWSLFVTTPALLAVWTAGLTMAIGAGWIESGWLRAKLMLVIGLSALHGVLLARLRRGEARRLRFALPGIAVAVAVIATLAATKPF